MSCYTHLQYTYQWKELINIVCPEINEQAKMIGALLEIKDIPFDYCVISRENNPSYEGQVELVALGLQDLFNLQNNEYAYVTYYLTAWLEISAQNKGSFVCDLVDFVKLGYLRLKWRNFQRDLQIANNILECTSKESAEYDALLNVKQSIENIISYYEKEFREHYYPMHEVLIEPTYDF